ncbi:MAG: hypothetical protein QF551_02975 [Candidatus Marinimicrobia bacterium]|jgi:hypothetical protein|nr:hypothetical protein [Candidatus Neomarinimicrobiota bacterium]MDP6966220.1 hypothetical protein [Candidatus Neomarinimicrobiota bacterium]
MTLLEERLQDLAGARVDVPEAGDFITRLHSELDRRKARKQSFLNAAASFGAVLLVFIGVMRDPGVGNEDYYPIFTEYQALLSEDETADAADIFTDETFVFEALDYLVEGENFIGNGWDLLQDLDELGLVDLLTIQNKEKPS